MTSGKKTGIIIGVLVVAALIAFGAVRYIESATVDMVRSWIADYSRINKTETGEITYSLLSNKLEIKDIKTSLDSGDMVQDITIASLEVDNPNRSLDTIMSGPVSGQAMVDVADAVIARGYASEVKSPAPLPGLSIKVTGALQRIDKIRIDAAVLAELKTGKTTPDQLYLDFAYGAEYAGAEAADIAIAVDGGAKGQVKMLVPGVKTVGYAKGGVKEASAQNIRVTLGEKELATFGLLRMADMNLPPKDVMQKLIRTQEQNLTKEQAMQALRSVLFGEKPFLGLFEIADFKLTPVSGMALSMGRFAYENPATHPFTFALKLDHLEFPVSLTPELAQLTLLGYKQLNVSGTFDMTLPDKTDELESALTLRIADMGKADIKVRGLVPGGLEGMDAMKVSLLEIGYSDEGLVPRAAAANKRLSGMEPDAALQLFESAMRSELLQDPAADKALTEQILQKFMEFARRPGSLRATIKPEPPLTFDQLAKLPDNSPAFSLVVEPGRQRLQEATQDALKAMTAGTNGK